MNIICKHGYFIVREDKFGEVARFNSIYNQDLGLKDDYYTFDFLREAESYSLLAIPYLGVPAIALYEGKPWEIMEANGFIYDFTAKIVKPIATVLNQTDPIRLREGYMLSGLVLPGSWTTEDKQITGYSCSLEILYSPSFKFYYTGFEYA